jgi:hypothetical protein
MKHLLATLCCSLILLIGQPIHAQQEPTISTQEDTVPRLSIHQKGVFESLRAHINTTIGHYFFAKSICTDGL